MASRSALTPYDCSWISHPTGRNRRTTLTLPSYPFTPATIQPMIDWYQSADERPLSLLQWAFCFLTALPASPLPLERSSPLLCFVNLDGFAITCLFWITVLCYSGMNPLLLVKSVAVLFPRLPLSGDRKWGSQMTPNSCKAGQRTRVGTHGASHAHCFLTDLEVWG